MASGSPAQITSKKKKRKGGGGIEAFQGYYSKDAKKKKKKSKDLAPGVYDQKADISAWKFLFLPKPIIHALSFLGFSVLTPIQALTLALAIHDNWTSLGLLRKKWENSCLWHSNHSFGAAVEVKKSIPAQSSTAVPLSETGSPSKAATWAFSDEIGI